MEKKIEIRPMTMMEYDALSDYAEELKSKNYTEDKQSRKLAMFVCEKLQEWIYKISLQLLKR